MKVKRLIEILSKLDQELEIGTTYDGLDPYDNMCILHGTTNDQEDEIKETYIITRGDNLNASVYHDCIKIYNEEKDK